MEYNFVEIEKNWRQYWAKNKTFKAEETSDKPKYYGLDMFPYPSGAGLHVGHPLGYIASDIYARYKRLKGFNVLHPMGYDSFGLPAEQYAIQTGQHPAITTEKNIERYRDQLDKIGFSFDWSREVRTSDPSYYKWTQWIFKQIYNAWYNTKSDKAEPIADLIQVFEAEGNENVQAVTDQKEVFTAEQWKGFSEQEQQAVLMNYRLTFLADSWVNWCPALGTVLANDEVKDGVSERGGYPVEQKLMRQWSMRISAYADRLLTGLNTVDWTDSIKEQQRNWIGKSTGASLIFELENGAGKIEVFTTRPDTVFGVNFLVLAPEHDLVDQITTDEFKEAVAEYKKQAGLKSERDRQSDVKNISGQRTGAYAIHPFTGEKVDVWIGDYVLVGYGTGAVMAVPAGDQRDWDFATHFGIEIKPIFEGVDVSKSAYAEKSGTLINSDFLNGMDVKAAIQKAVEEIEKRELGQGKTNYRLRDAVFSRQRYWGEPFPVYYKNETPYLIGDDQLPVTLPKVDKYLPTEDGEPPLARAEKSDWNVQFDGDRMEYNTMPGWAGSSWYFLRYMDPQNEKAFVSKEKSDYWNQVDLYIGGAEHATGHLLYSRFWTKFLYDMGYISFDEPFKKMINQGMILGRSSFVYRYVFFPTVDGQIGEDLLSYLKSNPIYVSYKVHKSKDKSDYFKGIIDLKKAEIENKFNIKLLELSLEFNSKLPVDINIVENDILDINAFKNWLPEYANAEFVLEDDGTYVCGHEVEKMSKSKYNVQTPDELVEKFGADTLRCYEMFLGPLEQSKPWDTQGINGVHNFLKKFWRLFFNAEGQFELSEGEADKKALKTLHKTIKKIQEDLDRFSFNTGVSNFMIAVNELTEQKCNNRSILKDLTVLLSPYAPHITEEIWKLSGETQSVSQAKFPDFNPEFLVEANHTYPVSFNGKMRFKIELPTSMGKDEVEKEVLSAEQAQKWLDGKSPKKVIVVPGKIVNVVV